MDQERRQNHRKNDGMYAQATTNLYDQALARGRRGVLSSTLTGRSHGLLSLESIAPSGGMHSRCDAGPRTVPISQICGSESRAGDFDRDFNPLQYYTKQRWLRVASARQRGKTLPPVALIQVGELYFVRDGHHRISVARALGQLDIEADVVVWQANGPLPWDTQTLANSRGSAGQRMNMQLALGRLRREGARLQKRALLSLRHLLSGVRMALKSPMVPRPSVDRV